MFSFRARILGFGSPESGLPADLGGERAWRCGRGASALRLRRLLQELVGYATRASLYGPAATRPDLRPVLSSQTLLG